MFTKNKSKRTYRYIQLACISLCFFQAGCSGAPPAPPTSLHYDVSCSPADARSQLRQYFSTQGIRTGEMTAPDNKSFALTTNPLKESSGKTESRISYKLEVKPAENANAAIIDLSRATVETKGVRERDWHDDDDMEATPPSEQQLTKAIQGICRSGQQ